MYDKTPPASPEPSPGQAREHCDRHRGLETVRSLEAGPQLPGMLALGQLPSWKGSWNAVPEPLSCTLSWCMWGLNSHNVKFACKADSCISSLWLPELKRFYLPNSAVFIKSFTKYMLKLLLSFSTAESYTPGGLNF